MGKGTTEIIFCDNQHHTIKMLTKLISEPRASLFRTLTKQPMSLALHLLCELLDLLYYRSSLQHNTSPTHKGKAKGLKVGAGCPPVSFIFSSRHSVGSISSRWTDGQSSLHSTYLHEINSPDSILFSVISHLSEPSRVPFIITQSHLTH